MGILGKLMFWKKDELGLNDELALQKGTLPMDELGLGSPGLPRQQVQVPEPSFQEPRPYVQQQPYLQQQPQYYSQNRDLELVSAKLDAMRATLESINQRLAGLERVAYGEEEHRKGW